MAKLFVYGWSDCPMTSEKFLFSIMTTMMWCVVVVVVVVFVVVVVVGVVVCVGVVGLLVVVLVETLVVGLLEPHAATPKANSAMAVLTCQAVLVPVSHSPSV